MNNKIQAFIRQFKNSKFYRHTITSYLLIGCVAIVLFSFLIVLNINRISIKQISDINLKTLTQASNTGTLIISDMHRKFHKEFSENPAVISAMFKSELTIEDRLSIYKFFSTVLFENSLIDSIYIFNFKNNTVFSSASIQLSIDNFYDTDILEWLKTSESDIEMTFARQTPLILNNAVINEEARFITTIYRVDNSSALVINMKQEDFSKLVSVTSASDLQQTLVFNQRGDIIANSGTTYSSDTPEIKTIYEKISSSNKRSGALSFKNMLVNYVTSDYLNYTYLTIYDANKSPASGKTLILYTVWGTIAFIFLNLISGIFFSQKAYKPVQKLMSNFYKKEQMEFGNSNELELIVKDVSELRREYTSLQTVENKYMFVKRNKLLKDILLGNITPFGKLYDDLSKECGIAFFEDYFAVIILKIDSNERETDIEPELMHYAIINIGAELLSSIANVYGVDFENDIAFILNRENASFNNIESIIENIQANVNNHFNLTVSAAIDNSAVSLENIPESYNHAKYTMLYSLVYPPNSIIRYKEIIKRADENTRYPSSVEKKITESIKAENLSEINTHVKDFINKIKDSEYNKIFMFASQLLIEIERTFQSVYRTDSDSIELSIVELFNSIDSLEELEIVIINYCRDIIENHSSVQIDKKDVIVQSIIDHINQHYKDPALNIDGIANSLGYSHNYIRITFKNALNISISNYINDIRFEEIYRLLEETNIPVKDVCEMVGLTYGGYFHTSFKKRTGFTPDKFRTLKKKKHGKD